MIPGHSGWRKRSSIINTRHTAAWLPLIDSFLDSLRVAGSPDTTVETRRQHLTFLARRIALAPTDVTADVLTAWCADQSWAQETRRSRQTTYRLFWRWAKKNAQLRNVAKNLPQVSPVAGVPRPTPDSIYAAALQRADPRTRLILRLAAECGLRRNEIALIHSDDLIQDLVGWSLFVHGKGNRKRVIPLTDLVAHELRKRPEGWAFPGQIDGHLSPRRVGELATDVLDGQWTLHTLRHRFATRAYQVDRDVFAVQELLGHSSPVTTRRYVQSDRSRLRDLVQQAAG